MLEQIVEQGEKQIKKAVEEQKDKLQKIFTLFGFSGLALLFVIFLLL